MIEKKLSRLSAIDIFHDLSDNERKDIVPYIKTINCSPGKMFFMPEERGEVIYFLIEGKVQLYRISFSGKNKKGNKEKR